MTEMHISLPHPAALHIPLGHCQAARASHCVTRPHQARYGKCCETPGAFFGLASGPAIALQEVGLEVLIDYEITSYVRHNGYLQLRRNAVLPHTYLQPVKLGSGMRDIIIEILLPWAVHLEERLTVSQSVPEPASRQAVRQIHTVWVFCQWQMRPQAAGTPCCTVHAVAEW